MKKLLVISGKGGTGKTTVAAAMVRFAQAAAVADCDVDAPNLHLVLPLAGEPEQIPFFGSPKAHIDAGACDYCGRCAGACRFDAITEADGHYGVNAYACEGCGVCAYVCPRKAVTLQPDVAGARALYTGPPAFSTATLRMGRGNSGKLVTAVKGAMEKAAPEAALAVIDGSPGIGCPVIASVSGVDLALVVTEPTASGFSDLRRLLRTAEMLGVRVAVCVNRFDVHPQTGAQIERYCREHDVPLVGRVPGDPHVPEAVNAGVSIAEVDCPARAALLRVFDNVMALLKEGRT